MGLGTIILTLIVIGLILYLSKKYIPMDPAISSTLTTVVVICVILWLLSLFGLFSFLDNVKVGR